MYIKGLKISSTCFDYLSVVNILQYCLLIFLFIFSTATHLLAQRANSIADNAEYIKIYNEKKYDQALILLKNQLNSVYNERVHEKRVPTEYIYIKKGDNKKKLNDLFKKRKAQPYFIEDNNKLFTLHLYLAKTYSRLDKYNESLNNYYQCLRFKPIEPGKDDILFFEISQLYKKLDYFIGYITCLEKAYSLNPTQFEYSLELGLALKASKEKKKAIYHLARYINSKGEDIQKIDLFLLLGNLYEDIGKYLETEKYYKKYLEKKENNGYINFALGYLAYLKTGNHKLALDCFNKSLNLLPENDLFRRSKATEYKGDIFLKELEFSKAIAIYLSSIKYQEMIMAEVEQKKNDIIKINKQIKNIISSMKKEHTYDKFNKYEYYKDEKGKIELQNRQKLYELKKLNAGKTRWNIALSYEKIENIDKSIKYYRESINYNYNANKARNKIMKLKLKLKRGY